jgi:hypothetical protein
MRAKINAGEDAWAECVQTQCTVLCGILMEMSLDTSEGFGFGFMAAKIAV